jgi:hypothetical protein
MGRCFHTKDHTIKSKIYFPSRRRKRKKKQKINLFFKAKDILLGNVYAGKKRRGGTMEDEPAVKMFFFTESFPVRELKRGRSRGNVVVTLSGEIIKLEAGVLKSNPNSGRDRFFLLTNSPPLCTPHSLGGDRVCGTITKKKKRKVGHKKRRRVASPRFRHGSKFTRPTGTTTQVHEYPVRAVDG